MKNVSKLPLDWTSTSNGSEAEQLLNPITRFVEALQTQPGGPQGYRLRRIILTNFWLYGQQEFEIPHGRLFLAGENASGKSTVLTAALPLGLDGDMRPNRLDTFGGRDRRIDYYVLGNPNSATPFDHERRTSYIALEFEWCDPDHAPIAPEIRQRWENGDRQTTRFLTIGVSIAGNANTTERIRPLRFLITDGSRLGHELDTLYSTGNGQEKRAYDHLRFKQVLEPHGIICDSQSDYERQVARYLFGFADVKDFEKLINLLLVLRRPNLSTELNFSRVHDYLKLSLPKISSETTSHVIGTIERIDGIQSALERIQAAFSSSERVHLARQHVAHVRAQQAACAYIMAQQAETSIQSRTNRLRRELSAAETERDQAASHVQDLQTEQYQIAGQMKALEANEGLQIATRLTTVRSHYSELAGQLHLQEQSLTSAQMAVQENMANLQRQQQRMHQVQAESLRYLQALTTIATAEALWETTAFQLQAAHDEVRELSLESGAAPQIPLVVTLLTGTAIAERTDWLHTLAALHQQRETQDAQIQNARNLETTRFQELDEVRRHLQAARDRFTAARADLDELLLPFFSSTATERIETNALFLFTPDTDLPTDEPLPQTLLEQSAALLQNYRENIDALENALVSAVDQAQRDLNSQQRASGGKMQALNDLNLLYTAKLAEPEATPIRTERHLQARTQLADHGIPALPLYALLDFVPDLAPTLAGQVECMLEDAGLLDALVIPDAQVAAADALLQSLGLSDCRLNLALLDSQGSAAASISSPPVLCFDTTLLETPVNAPFPTDWQAAALPVLAALQPYTESTMSAILPYALYPDGQWQHGLLTGLATTGPVRFIGQRNRIEARQREIAALLAQRAALEAELSTLKDNITLYEQQIAHLQEQQSQLRKLLQRSKLDESYAELTQTHMILESSRAKYQKARQHTQELRQHYNTLLVQLERESATQPVFASDARRVQTALLALVKLENQAHAAQQQLQTVLYTWEEYQQLLTSLQKAQDNAHNIDGLASHVRTQVVQVQAELSELQLIAASSNADELSLRLQQYRTRADDLISELDSAKNLHIRGDERASNLALNLAEFENNLYIASADRAEKQELFTTQLAAYPVEQLIELQQTTETFRAAQSLLAPLSGEGNSALQKELLEGMYRDAYTALVRVFHNEQPLLLEYGPDLDDQGQVFFRNESNSRPVELLTLLGERIAIQHTLLGEEERQLFEDFLLQEIAEAIRTQILEAEEWVQQINDVLGHLPLIGEHYSLQWKPPAEYDITKPGSHLAQHYRLLRKPAQTLTEEERETLMSSFRREIEGVRVRQQTTPDTNFLEALEQVFDYREWFHFDVWVTPIGGQRQRLTDRVAGTRSGAEQLFALYVPLFAALGALYRSAAPGAPRLLALDEAFDKVSAANTQRIMEFLVSQDFQWIMSGPQVSGTGSKIPASARYLMIHEKGSPAATASASFWSDQQLNQSLSGTDHSPSVQSE